MEKTVIKENHFKRRLTILLISHVNKGKFIRHHS